MIRKCQDRLVQLQSSNTPSNTPSSHVRTTSWFATQPASIPPHAPRSYVPLSIPTTSSQRSKQSGSSRRTNLSRHPFPLPITNICHHIHTILFYVTQPASIPSHTPSPPMPPLVPPPKNVFEMQQNRNHNAGTRHDSPIPISITIHTVLLSATPPASISPHTPPTHNTYSSFSCPHRR